MPDAPLDGMSVLIVEDEPLLRRHLGASLENLGADVALADSLLIARKLISELNFDFALLDINLPDGKGTDLLKSGGFHSHTGVIVMTAEGAVGGAVDAMKLGAIDYLTKPVDPEALGLTLARARRSRAASRVEEHHKSESGDRAFFFGSALAGLEKVLEKIVAADRRMLTRLPPVLIQGETGTGKTTIARWLHSQGPRAQAVLVEMNCSAIPEHLAESELFGHEKGAFTDAKNGRLGLFEAANGGTLFLDELASLSLSVQAKLLTALESGRIRRVGGVKEIPVDVRVIAAANRDLRGMTVAGQFREDLFHRLDLFRIAIPPLRERGGDIIQLAESLNQKLSRQHRLPLRGISEIGRRRLLNYGWPGNVRELAHELERAIVFEESETLHFDQLMGAAPANSAESAAAISGWFNEAFVYPPSGFSLEDAILHMVHHALKQTDGNVSAAARVLGVSRDYLRYRLGTVK
ncbi:MAG TPA: sigma-54 dependent transcriptional regulator [Candidatus Limnocylindria bacterium]|nr:sigma-54 dependent transcriptional regulator [Candidatus Limnocylindria bacterium]